MTLVGQMLMEEGYQRGMEKGMEKGIQVFIQDNVSENIPKHSKAAGQFFVNGRRGHKLLHHFFKADTKLTYNP